MEKPPLKKPLDNWLSNPLENRSQNTRFHGRRQKPPTTAANVGPTSPIGRWSQRGNNASKGRQQRPFPWPKPRRAEGLPNAGLSQPTGLRACRPSAPVTRLPMVLSVFPRRVLAQPHGGLPNVVLASPTGLQACRPSARDTRLQVDAAQDVDGIVRPCACPTEKRLALRLACMSYRTCACRPFARDNRLNVDAAQDADVSGDIEASPQSRPLDCTLAPGAP